MIIEFLSWIYPRVLLTIGVFLLMCIINNLTKKRTDWKWSLGYSVGFFIGIVMLMQ